MKFGICLSTEKVDFWSACKNEKETLSNSFEEITTFIFLCPCLVGRYFFFQQIFSKILQNQKRIDIICENTAYNYGPYRGM